MTGRRRFCLAPGSTKSADAPDPAVLRRHLESVAAAGQTVTYQQVAGALGLSPPQTIHRVALALEGLMREDAQAGRPFLAAVVTRRAEPLPAPGFFIHAAALGAHDGPDSGPLAAGFHRAQLLAVWRDHGATGNDD